MLNINGPYLNLNKKDLRDVISDITEEELTYRDTIKVSEDITFGAEIEFEGIRFNKVKTDFKNSTYKVVRECTVTDSINIINPLGGELVSPILTDTNWSWASLKQVCEYLKENGAYTTDNCGGHVNIGTQILKDEKNILNLLKLWIAFEDVIFRFSYGESIVNRIDFRNQAGELAIKYKNIIYDPNFNSSFKYINKDSFLSNNKNSALSLKKADSLKRYTNNVIEVRVPNGTINEIIWQNNINFFVKLFEYAASSNFDDSIVAYYIKKRQISDYDLYDEIYLRKAIELSDMIFSSDIDKYYFLKQYLKDFKIKSYYEEYTKCK